MLNYYHLCHPYLLSPLSPQLGVPVLQQAIIALLDMCGCEVVDVLEAATSALANLTCYCDENCKRLMEGGGVKTIVNVLGQTYTGNETEID